MKLKTQRQGRGPDLVCPACGKPGVNAQRLLLGGIIWPATCTHCGAACCLRGISSALIFLIAAPAIILAGALLVFAVAAVFSAKQWGAAFSGAAALSVGTLTYFGAIEMARRAPPLEVIANVRRARIRLLTALLLLLGALITVVTWQTFSELRAKAEPAVGRELEAAAAVQAERLVKFTARWCDGLNERMRIVWRGENYNIRSLADVKGRRRELLIYTQGGVNQG